VLDVLPVRLDSFDAQVQLLGDLLHAQSATDELENLQLAVAECRGYAIATDTCEELPEDQSGESAADVELAPKHGVNSRQEFLGSFLLHDVAARTRPEHRLRVQGFILLREHENLALGILGRQILQGFHAVFTPQTKIK